MTDRCADTQKPADHASKPADHNLIRELTQEEMVLISGGSKGSAGGETA
ncbi:hypothetical protein MOV66_00070 [Agrobacterium sp. SHOUNA12C]|jgi:hypothetical protein|nr:hypothetical protein [Rhizobium rhizogenes]MCJ9720030.1 hypothetical protein [Agrobacterium sp. BETTINA12B]MCJ9755035.1 hypothetical protein [Agrobacterium sp. SHOUNA12C]NTF53063.1 hypothetical protein [Rhizobium rhizogenes]NTG18773.1 hypothetical protein [Rhizobium rhizogenes]NTH03620.1 hypothetical protein [Rhizobium rhizogenes]